MKLSSARLNFENGRLDHSLLKNYAETLVGGSTGTNAGATYTVDITTGNVFYLILNSATCTMTFPSGTLAGASFTLMLRQDATGGRLVSWPTVKWPSNDAPSLSSTPHSITFFTFVTPDSGTTWYGFISGAGHTLIGDGLLAWGLGTGGQMGENQAATRSAPVQVISNAIGWSKISGGGSFVSAIKTDATLWVWGQGTAGQLGQITTATSRSSPVQVGANKTWASVGNGLATGFAVTTSGQLWAWGTGTGGQLGQITAATSTSSPVQVASDKTWSVVAANVLHAAAVTTAGALWNWGGNANGQLGQISNVTNTSSPVQVASDKTWASVAAGGYHTAAITTAGALWAWGLGASGQLGQITTATSRSSPVQIASDKTWASAAAGGSHTAAITTAGALWAWGLNASGQLGQNTATNTSSPVQVASDKTWSSVAAGASHTLAVTASGQLWAWGLGSSGQIGDFTAITRSSPVQIGTSTKWVAVSTGASATTFALYDF